MLAFECCCPSFPRVLLPVIPAKAGIQTLLSPFRNTNVSITVKNWIPAFAGMTA